MWLAVELVPGPLEFTSTKKCKSDHGFEVPKRPIFRSTSSTDMVQQVLQWERQKWFSHCKYQGTIIQWHGPMGFAVREAKMVLTLQMSGDHGREMPIFMKFYPLIYFLIYFLNFRPAKCYCSQEERRKKGEGQTWRRNPKTALVGHISNKISTSTFGAWSLLLVHRRFTHSEGPKVL